MFSSNQQKKLQLIARILLSSIFLYSGFSKITGWEGTVQFMSANGIPMPSVLILGAIATEMAGVLALISGYKLKEAGILLILYLVPTTLIFHSFWAMEGQQFHTQILDFLKNLSIMGGLLLLTTLNNNPGKASIEQ